MTELDSVTELESASKSEKPTEVGLGIRCVYPKTTATGEMLLETYEANGFVLGQVTGLDGSGANADGASNMPGVLAFSRVKKSPPPPTPKLWLNHTPPSEALNRGTFDWAYRVEIPLSPRGFFSQTTQLPEPGTYPFQLTLETTESTEDTQGEVLDSLAFKMIRQADGFTPVEAGCPIELATLFPQKDAYLVKHREAAEAVLFEVRGEAGLLIDVVCTQTQAIIGTLQPLSALPAYHQDTSPAPWFENRVGIFAERHWVGPRYSKDEVYRATLNLDAYFESPSNPSSLSIQYRVRRENEETITEWQPQGTFYALHNPPLAQVLNNDTVCRVSPPDGHRLTPILEGCVLPVHCVLDDWCQVQISSSLMGWIQTDQLRLPDLLACVEKPDTECETLPAQAIPMVKVHHDNHETTIIIPMERRIPIQVRDEDLWGMVCHLPQSVSKCDFVHFTGDLVDGLETNLYPDGDTECVLVISTPKAICGYEFEFVNHEDGLALHWTVRHFPSQWTDWKILIDPGHGGSETGALSLDGTPEKDLNLKAAKQLNKVLREAGLTATLSRHVDKDLSLDERLDKVRQLKPHVVLSLHHNALPDGRDPLGERGVGTYYYHPYSKSLALQIQRLLPEATGLPSYGLLYDNLFMTRIHEATSLLIELAFLINPDDCEVINSTGFYQKQSEAILAALRSYYEWTESIYHHAL